MLKVSSSKDIQATAHHFLWGKWSTSVSTIASLNVGTTLLQGDEPLRIKTCNGFKQLSSAIKVVDSHSFHALNSVPIIQDVDDSQYVQNIILSHDYS